jgi:internalin A
MPTADEAYLSAERAIEEQQRSPTGTLSLNGRNLTMLPPSIGRLHNLWYLDLDHNELTSLPESFAELKRLKFLHMDSNRFKELPEWFGELISLENLYVRKNQLTTIPDSLARLKNLDMLNLSGNRLTSLPESLRELKSLRELFLHENPGLGIPPEILGPTWVEVRSAEKPADPQAILAFYFGKQKQTAKPLNEVKLLLVGHGRVGKTSLSKALRGMEHDDREPETPGIERHKLGLQSGNSTITTHIWDFGGQEFLHQTHQFFFSERSIYLVVLSGRQGRPMQEAEYWLRLIRTYGAGSPVIVALNQIKAHPFTVDEHFLKENYPEVQAVVKTDCDPRYGIEQLRKLLTEVAWKMPSVRQKIDPTWIRVRTRLEDMGESFVTFAHYQQICAAEGVKESESQKILATILNYLGIALNYRDDPRLRETSVLKPRWLVDGIYTILRWLHKHETNGQMKLDDFPKALRSKKEYPTTMHPFLLALMEKFELCFPVEGKDAYLVPGLLDANQPGELKEFIAGDARRIQFWYEDVRPPGLLPRFIVRSHTLSENQPRWLRGVVLARGSARALVRGDHEGRLTDVFAIGEVVEDRIWLTELILSEMRALNDKLPVRTLVFSGGAWTDLEVLRADAQKNGASRTERGVDGRTVTVDVQQTLREVETPEASTPATDPLSLFVCYSRKDERFVRQLIPGLKVLARRGYIVPWRDTDLIPGEDWDETIKQRLLDAHIILFMVSREFLASDYITAHERPMAMELAKQKKSVIVPILLSDCLWKGEDFEVFENLPRKGEAVSSFPRRDTAWNLVEKGLINVVEKQRRLLTRFSL